MHEGIAICSEVQLVNGETAHMVLLDGSADYEVDFPDELDELIVSLGNRKGYILETDNGFHFYGVELLKQTEWEALMNNLRNNPDFDSGFAYYSLHNGYSALRIFDYAPDKEVVPEVVHVMS